MEAIEDLAKRGNVTAEQFAHGVLVHLPTTMGLMQDENKLQVQMMAITWAVLEGVKQHAPGPILDVVAQQDITATLFVREEEYTVRIEGRPGQDAEMVAVH
jgi:hypothetical protein